jgi:hypothetical protein
VQVVLSEPYALFPPISASYLSDRGSGIGSLTVAEAQRYSISSVVEMGVKDASWLLKEERECWS